MTRPTRPHISCLLALASLLLLPAGCKRTSNCESADDDTDDTTVSGDSDSVVPDTATDTSSATDMPETTAAMQDLSVFSQDHILEYHITIDEADLAELDANGNEEVYKRASLRVTGDGIDETFAEVGFRYKGAWSLHHCWDDNDGVRSYEEDCARLSTKIKFNEYDSESRFFGLKKLNLHSMMGDRTKMRERLSYSLFNDFGVIAPRTAHAKLYVNGSLFGLYIAVEAIDGRFTHFRFPDAGDGNLFKELWPSPNVGESWALEKLRTNDSPEDNPDVSDFIQFKDTIAATTVDDFEPTVAPFLDLDNLIRYFVVDRATRNWDGITGFYSSETSHNFYWYHDDGERGLFHLVPWDLNTTLGEFDYFMDPQSWCADTPPLPNWNEKPYNCDPRPTCFSEEPRMTPPRCDHFIDMLALTQWPLFEQRGAEFLADIFSYDSMNAKITTWAEQIADSVDEDPLWDKGEWEAELDEFRDILRDAISDFQDHLNEGLIDEEAPVELVPPNDALITATTEAGGLRADPINNFEVAAGTESAFDDYWYSYASEGTALTGEWHTDTPIGGAADMRITVDFAATEGDWSEWAGFVFAAEAPLDLTPYTRMWFSASANKNGVGLRIQVRSDTYDDYGDIYQMFSKDFNLSETPSFHTLALEDLSYPQWAKNNWEDGEGWTAPDGEILAQILANVSGISLEFAPTRDDSGNMTADTEQIIVHIDNIYFE